MKLLYKSAFRKFVKKQTRPLQLAIEDEIEKIARNPDVGEAKTADLQGLRVHKFKFKRQPLLIAYRATDSDILFYLIGTRENFYRDLKRYLKEIV